MGTGGGVCAARNDGLVQVAADEGEDVQQEQDEQGEEGVVQEAQKDVHAGASPATKRRGTVPKVRVSPCVSVRRWPGNKTRSLTRVSGRVS